MKKLTSFLAAILSFILCLSGVSPALAQGLSEPAARGITTFYANPDKYLEGVKVYGHVLDYDVAIPNPNLRKFLPEKASDFPAAYKPILEAGRRKNGTNGSFTEGRFDLEFADAVIPGTNTFFTVNPPPGGRIYTVVAAVPVTPTCSEPVTIETTEVAFFDKVEDAQKKANELDQKGLLVYVSPDDDLTIKAFSQIFYDQATGKKKIDSSCFLFSGATEKVTTDFTKIFYLLPPELQQPARQEAFQFLPRYGSFIYLVNARKKLTIPPRR